jgi:hypothetical protein
LLSTVKINYGDAEDLASRKTKPGDAVAREETQAPEINPKDIKVLEEANDRKTAVKEMTGGSKAGAKADPKAKAGTGKDEKDQKGTPPGSTSEG